MIKYVVQYKLNKEFRIAFRITCLSEERKYLKEKYNFCASSYDVGKFLIVDEGTGIHFVMSGHAFNKGYDIVKRTVMYPAIPFAKSDDDVESENDKRREMLHENIYDWWTRNMMNSVYGAPDLRTPMYIDTDAPSCYPYLLFGYDIHNMCGSDMIWHLDIREMNKEKDTMITKSKTINFCVKKVIFNGPATIVIWGDGTKTVVKCADGDSYSKWAGFAMCIAKRLYGDDFHYIFRHFCGVEDDIPKKNTGDVASVVSEAVDSASNAFESFRKNVTGFAETLPKVLSEYGKSTDYRDVVFKDRNEAVAVLQKMCNIADQFGSISVADYCELVGVPHSFTDNFIGWRASDKYAIFEVMKGFKIKLPEPIRINVASKPNEAKGLD